MTSSYALSWKPCQGDSLNLPDHRIHKDGDGDASFQLNSDSLPHAHAQTTKTFYKHQDSRKGSHSEKTNIFGLFTSRLINAACKKSLNLLKKGLLVQGKLRQLPKEEYRDGLQIADMDQNQRDLPRDIPLDSVVVLRYEKRSKSENKGKVPTEMELVLEQTQQGTSYEVSVDPHIFEGYLKMEVKDCYEWGQGGGEKADEHGDVDVDLIIPMTSHGLQKVMMNNGLFLIRFESKQGWDDLSEDGPYMIRSVPIILKKWSPDVNLSKEDLMKVSVWVKLHNVAIVAFTSDGLSMVATILGKHIILDSYMSFMCIESWGHGSFARALSDLDATCGLKDMLVVAIPKSEGSSYRMETNLRFPPWGHAIDDIINLRSMIGNLTLSANSNDKWRQSLDGKRLELVATSSTGVVPFLLGFGYRLRLEVRTFSLSSRELPKLRSLPVVLRSLLPGVVGYLGLLIYFCDCI
ncbi:zinc knuckle CX2CX4HX4C containing protein [Tanacetum coccineum]